MSQDWRAQRRRRDRNIGCGTALGSSLIMLILLRDYLAAVIGLG